MAEAKRVERVLRAAAETGTYVFPLLAALAAAGMSLDVDQETKSRYLLCAIVLTVLAFVSAWTAGFLRRRQVKRAETAAEAARDTAVEELTDYILALTGSITPLSNYVAEMATQPSGAERKRQLGLLQHAAVASLTKTGPGQCHAAVYRLKEGPVLERVSYDGPGRAPRMNFGLDTADGRDALTMVLERGTLQVADAQNDKSVRPEGGYGSVMAVHIGVQDRLYGMLTLDAPDVGALSDTDLALMLSVANILAAGFAMARGGGMLPSDLKQALSPVEERSTLKGDEE